MDEFQQTSKHSGGWWFQFRARALRLRRVWPGIGGSLSLQSAAGLAVASWLIFQQRVVYVSSGRMMVSGRINLQEGAVFSEELRTFLGLKQS